MSLKTKTTGKLVQLFTRSSSKKDTNQNYSNNIELTHESETTKLYTIKNTPFTIAVENGQHHVTIGKYRISETFETIEEAYKDSERTDWYRIMAIAGVVASEEIINNAKENQKNKKV